MEQKWGLEEENGDDEGNSEKGTLLFTFCQYTSFDFFNRIFFIFCELNM